jgi:hypothetical protein
MLVGFYRKSLRKECFQAVFQKSRLFCGYEVVLQAFYAIILKIRAQIRGIFCAWNEEI